LADVLPTADGTRECLSGDPCSSAGPIFVFRDKHADRVKLIIWDGTGLCLFAKRLEQGAFRWPKVETARCASRPRS
jgi:transposase